jgi:hypothetical protein
MLEPMSQDELPPASVREANTREHLQKIGVMIDEGLPQNWGFFLMVFPFHNEPGSMNYIAKARREEVLLLMLEFVYRNIGGLPGVLSNAPPKEEPK